ncbi:L-amino acid N-acetyltransferase AaaT [Paraburkholderia domus]|jgi:Acetyltransferases, including N-acetylases of ribosomal proteins|uniref:L-amino acid N-acetyltransferase AaaT n=1 Tax=Paraburkholderia domus TaxID=2793075 RepID=A0A9N8QWS6_9BURK|nr:GNAT family N-acetyltransferase [Paraburkholderia domus]MBK5050060.1 GNAT family N-acetyltransferase [Burkholderia sp. R-70006]MBK5064246.1 GNAT family N-acetyltransferase [Burkholderia sp. R-70199]MBK5086795.1 GNAT family N-acetyltransferase [Burkholderia sp. R-69927]MBK5121518.1 GNAT family N-acetyltransferase [Burkholderia sp. R-69980]MBK5166661.1 GNAT family N-acetyltransferase [Burkholderia sp. R-70211]MBK5185343.1 GNAT family N-acetyltransferase [Burkholderia sp. R-69749]MCI0147198.
MKEETLQSDAALDNRITVRALESSDMDAFAEIMSLPGVRRGTLSVGYRSPEQLKAWYERRLKGGVNVCASIGGRVVGHAGLEVHRPSRAHCAHLGLAVHDAYHGCGVGTALLQGLTDCADASLGLRRIDLTVFTDNAPAIALYRKFGFVEEGRSRGFALRDGILTDVLHMARLVDAPRLQAI